MGPEVGGFSCNKLSISNSAGEHQLQGTGVNVVWLILEVIFLKNQTNKRFSVCLPWEGVSMKDWRVGQ